MIGYWAKKAGHCRRKGGSTDNLQAVRKEIADLKERLNQLTTLEKQLQVYFEPDGRDHVLVYGITIEPISAHWKQWMNFLGANGAAKLRDYIQEKFGEKPNGKFAGANREKI
jgi:hypothetical protein